MAKILIIDDDGIVRDALTVFLVRDGHEVISAADGANGIQVFKADIPDLVILDRALPLISGSGVFEAIRKISKTVPILMLTGYDSPEEGEIYMKNGAAAFLSKSDGLSHVLGVVAEMLGRAGKGPAQQRAAAAPAPAADGKDSAASILIAEDDEAMLEVLERCFKSAGYTVLTAADGIAAERVALEKRPDIILLDIFMPGKNGVEVLETLSRELPGTGIMMLSGNDDEEIARSCTTKGACDYFPKPPNLDMIELAVKARLLQQRGHT